MAEAVRISALAGCLQAGRHGVQSGEPGITLRELRPAAMAAINGAPAPQDLGRRLAQFPGATPSPRRAAGGPELELLWSGPDQFLAVSERLGPGALVDTLASSLSGTDATVVDLSHGRTVLVLEGAACRELLAKGCALDVDAMESGECVPTLLSHFNVLLHCDGEQSFRLYVMRSFGEACYRWLLHAGAEFGVEVVVADG